MKVRLIVEYDNDVDPSSYGRLAPVAVPRILDGEREAWLHDEISVQDIIQVYGHKAIKVEAA